MSLVLNGNFNKSEVFWKHIEYNNTGGLENRHSRDLDSPFAHLFQLFTPLPMPLRFPEAFMCPTEESIGSFLYFMGSPSQG